MGATSFLLRLEAYIPFKYGHVMREHLIKKFHITPSPLNLFETGIYPSLQLLPSLLDLSHLLDARFRKSKRYIHW